MSNKGKDSSGNAFKYSLIPLLAGVTLIFGLYYGCNQDMIHDTEPKPLSKDLRTQTKEEIEKQEKQKKLPVPTAKM